MALLSGEVETWQRRSSRARPWGCSGWLCYPGKLKRVQCSHYGLLQWGSSGWLCYPGKLKPGSAGGLARCEPGSGWLCYPGKLKRRDHQHRQPCLRWFRMALLSGEVETLAALHHRQIDGSTFRMALLSGEVETSRSSRRSIRAGSVPDGFAIRGS